MQHSQQDFKEGYEDLIKHGYLDTQVMMETSFYEDSCTNSLWGLFVNAGYLTIQNIISAMSGIARIGIPNQEVAQEFHSLTANYLSISENTMDVMFYYLRNKNLSAFFEKYRSILLELTPYHDLKDENSYHMMMLGLCAWLSDNYQIISNRESGKGRCDTIPLWYIILKAKKKELPSFVLEFKYSKESNQLKALANQAIDQIIAQKYDQELSGEIIYIGLAHCGKDVEMCWQEKQK